MSSTYIHIIDWVLLKGHWKTIILSIIYIVQQQVNIYHYWHVIGSRVWISVASPRRGVGGSGPHFCSDPYLLRFAQIRWKVFYIGGVPCMYIITFYCSSAKKIVRTPTFFGAGVATIGFNHHEKMQSEHATWHVSITPNSHSYSWTIYTNLPKLKGINSFVFTDFDAHLWVGISNLRTSGLREAANRISINFTIMVRLSCIWTHWTWLNPKDDKQG